MVNLTRHTKNVQRQQQSDGGYAHADANRQTHEDKRGRPRAVSHEQSTASATGATKRRRVAHRSGAVDSQPLSGATGHSAAQRPRTGVSSQHDELAEPAHGTTGVVVGEDRGQGVAGVEGTKPEFAEPASGLKRKKKRPFSPRFRLRMLKLAPLIPELRCVTDNRFLIAWVWNLADNCSNPLESLIDYAACIGRTLSTEEAETVVAEADSMERQRESLALSKWLGITKALCVKYRLKTICGCDTTPAERKRGAARVRQARRRFEAGILPGARAAKAKTRRAEIAASGISKSQWYRREKAKNEAMRLSRHGPSSLLLQQGGSRRDARVASAPERAVRRPAKPQPTSPQYRPRHRHWVVRPTSNPDVVCLIFRPRVRPVTRRAA
jgi:hypothetical protein